MGKKEDERTKTILKTFQDFGIKMETVEVLAGPVVSYFVFKLKTPTRMKELENFDRDLNHALGVSNIRIDAPIRDTSLIGVEVPDKERKFVPLKELWKNKEFAKNKKRLVVPFGRLVGSEDFFVDLYELPHLLITGTTGSGKSNFLHCLLNSFLQKSSPDEVKLILVDPKRVDLVLYNGLPYLLSEVIVDSAKAISALCWLEQEMERRYELLTEKGMRNIERYNETSKEKMPYILYIVDEFADVFYSQKKNFEGAVLKILQMGRAVGCHVILCTSKPTKDIMRSLVSANMPSRLSFHLCCASDSKEVLYQTGAEKLLREGDALFQGIDDIDTMRLQTPFISEEEIVSNIKNAKKKYGSFKEMPEEYDDPSEAVEEDLLYEKAKEIVIKNGKASSSLLQRKLRIGYSRAAKLIDRLEENGIIGSADGSAVRKVIWK